MARNEEEQAKRLKEMAKEFEHRLYVYCSKYGYVSEVMDPPNFRTVSMVRVHEGEFMAGWPTKQYFDISLYDDPIAVDWQMEVDVDMETAGLQWKDTIRCLRNDLLRTEYRFSRMEDLCSDLRGHLDMLFGDALKF